MRSQNLARREQEMSQVDTLDLNYIPYIPCIRSGRLTSRPFYSCVLRYLAMNASEAGVDCALIQTSLFFSCK